jgi:hypothetical protein
MHLAAAGYRVHGLDIVPRAVEAARTEANRRGLSVTFSVADFFKDDPGGRYDLVFDRSVISNARDHEERVQFASRVASALLPGGWWLNVTGCADNRAADGAPDTRGYPRLTLIELVAACEPRFEIRSVSRASFGASAMNDFTAWVLVMKLRQPEEHDFFVSVLVAVPPGLHW